MSGVKGKVRENADFTRETGFFEGEVIAINPEKAELEKLLGTEIEGEVEYLSTEDIDGKIINRAQIVFWVKDVITNKLRPARFFLKDLNRTNSITEEEREKGDKVDKKQYINSVGVTTWTDKVENLPDWFTQRSYRIAKVGEEELYNFIQSWLNKLDRFDADTSLSFDFKKLISGDVRDLKEQMKGEYDGTITCLVTVRKVSKEGEEDKFYEQIYSRKFMPGFVWQKRLKENKVKHVPVDATFIQKAKSADRKKRSSFQKFVLEVTDSQFGVKDFYSLEGLETFNPENNPIASGKALVEDDTSY